MSSISIRLDPELEKRLEHEVRRKKITKSKYVQDLLQSVLNPKDSLSLLLHARHKYDLPESSGMTPTTHRASQVKKLVNQIVRAKHNQSGKKSKAK